MARYGRDENIRRGREATKALVRIADECAERRMPFPSTRRLAQMIGVHQNTVNSKLAELHDGEVFRLLPFHHRRRVEFPDGRRSA